MSINSGVKSALGELTKLSLINLNTPKKKRGDSMAQYTHLTDWSSCKKSNCIFILSEGLNSKEGPDTMQHCTQHCTQHIYILHATLHSTYTACNSAFNMYCMQHCLQHILHATVHSTCIAFNMYHMQHCIQHVLHATLWTTKIVAYVYLLTYLIIILWI